MKEMEKDNFNKIVFELLGVLLLLVIPLMIMNTMKGGFIEVYLSALGVLFLGPFIVPLSIVTWEFDILPFSLWYILLFWTLPPIIIGIARADEDEKEFARKYSAGYFYMLSITVVVLFIGIIGAIAFGMY